MKKLRSIIIFAAVLTTMAVLFCFSANAAEWNQHDVFYTYDQDTGVMVMRGEGTTVSRHTFGESSSYCFTEDGSCYCWDFPDEEEPSEKTLKAYDAAKNAKFLIINNGVNFDTGSLCHFKNVETLILPDSLKTIPDGLCYGMSNLKTVVLPSELTEIGRESFAYCKKLTNITIPDSVEMIKYKAFFAVDTSKFLDFDKIKTVEEGNKIIPDNLKSVRVNAYSDLVGLRWDDVDDASGYRVFIREGNKWKKLVDTSREYYLIYNLESNKKYTFAVRPYRRVDGNTYWASSFVKVTTTTATPKTTATVKSSKSGTATVKWADIEGERGYQVWYALSVPGSAEYFERYGNYKAGVTAGTVKGLKSGKTYAFKVRSYKKVAGKYVYSDFSGPVRVKIK